MYTFSWSRFASWCWSKKKCLKIVYFLHNWLWGYNIVVIFIFLCFYVFSFLLSFLFLFSLSLFYVYSWSLVVGAENKGRLWLWKVRNYSTSPILNCSSLQWIISFLFFFPWARFFIRNYLFLGKYIRNNPTL